MVFSSPHKPIGRKRKKDNEEAKPKLHLRGKALGVNDGQDIMLKKSSGISRLIAGLSEPVFQGRKRADPPPEFQGRRPECGGKMNPWDPAPPDGENSPEQDEGNEGEVDQKYQFSKDLPKHVDDLD